MFQTSGCMSKCFSLASGGDRSGRDILFFCKVYLIFFLVRLLTHFKYIIALFTAFVYNNYILTFCKFVKRKNVYLRMWIEP